MRVRILVLCLLGWVLATRQASAQMYFTSAEMGLSWGGSQYFGDLNDRYGLKTIHGAYGMYVRKHYNQYISFKAGAYYTTLSYADKVNDDLYQRQRNLDFTSHIAEASVQAEFNFFRFVTGDPYHRFTPYLTMGAGAFIYNPFTTYQGAEYDLRAMGTEGQNLGGYDERKYSNISPCVPIGVGFKYWIVGGINLTIEIADRLTMTDYIDDVSTTYVGLGSFPVNPKAPAYLLQDRSIEVDPAKRLGRPGKQRGNASTRDQYLMGLISLSWHFRTYRCPNFMDRELIQVN